MLTSSIWSPSKCYLFLLESSPRDVFSSVLLKCIKCWNAQLKLFILILPHLENLGVNKDHQKLYLFYPCNKNLLYFITLKQVLNYKVHNLGKTCSYFCSFLYSGIYCNSLLVVTTKWLMFFAILSVFFFSAPFTIQRLSELIVQPRKHYKVCSKFYRGILKVRTNKTNDSVFTFEFLQTFQSSQMHMQPPWFFFYILYLCRLTSQNMNCLIKKCISYFHDITFFSSFRIFWLLVLLNQTL